MSPNRKEHESCIGYRNIVTCSKGFEQKVATLRLKTLLKIKENFIGNKTIDKEITRNAGPS